MKKFFVLLGLSWSLLTQAETLNIAVEANYPPYSFNDDQGLPTGFDVDLIKEMGKVAGFTPEFRTAKRTELTTLLNEGKVDIFASALSINPERLNIVDMTNPIINFEWVLALLDTETNGKFQKVDDFSNSKISILGSRSSLVERATSITGSENNVQKIETSFLALKAVYQQKADATLADDLVIAYYHNIRPDLKLRTVSLGEGRLNLGYAVKKGNTQLIEKLNQALTTLKSNGEYDKLLEKYFGKEFSKTLH